MKNVTVLFPGGFKPITGAHMALAQRYAQNSQVDKVIMLIVMCEMNAVRLFEQTHTHTYNALSNATGNNIRETRRL